MPLLMGVNDYVVRPIDPNELLARVRTQVKRKRYIDHLRVRLEESVEMAILDPLTGLHNRRYMTSHLATLFEEASQRGKPLSVQPIDIDHFKAGNDSHGHDTGHAVLREFASRIRRNTRGIDLACRLGGEEFVVVMPDCDLAMACQVGERLPNASRRLLSRSEGRSACCRSRRASAWRRLNLTTIPPSSC
jgi:two-component system cell cycle response regulator